MVHSGGWRRTRRWARAAVAVVAATVLLTGCSSERVEQWQRAGLPEPATEETSLIGNLWVGTWIAGLGVGALVWGLILWAVIVYRKRDDRLPPQVRFNVPIEFLYTTAPFAVIGALFFFTVDHQNQILDDSEEPDLTIGVVAHQWAWSFNYLDEGVYDPGTTYLAGVPGQQTLYLPVNQTVRFELESHDVIHSFWVPSFYMKMDVFPGQHNSFQVTPDREGSFAGKCAEYCGTYHARMLFDVEVVSEEEYQQQMENLRAEGFVGELNSPISGAFETEMPGGAGSDS